MEFIPGPAVHQILCADCAILRHPHNPEFRQSLRSVPPKFVNCSEAVPARAPIQTPRGSVDYHRGHPEARLREAPHDVSTFELEYLVQHGQCPDCASWPQKYVERRFVQVRQKCPSKRTFLFLEQLILKHGAQKDTIAVKEVKAGLDFILQSAEPRHQRWWNSCRASYNLSHPSNCCPQTRTLNTANYKFPYSVEARQMEQHQPLASLLRVGNSLQLMDPTTLQAADISSAAYWRTPFESLATVSDLVEFTVLDVEPDGRARGKWRSRARSVRTNPGDGDGGMDYDGGAGRAAQIYHTRTHLGALLQPGDTALGYHLTNANFNSADYAALPTDRLPDIVLVKKAYPNRRKKSKARNWRLRSIGKEAGEEGETGGGRGVVGRMGGRDQRKVEEDYELFLRELEEDPEMRGAVNLYKAPEGDTRMGPPPGEGRAGGGKGSRRKAQFAMDVDVADEAPPERVVDVVDPEEEDEEEDEADFQRSLWMSCLKALTN
ncbi:RNA binding protein [Mycena latifolia]|nr:RNA binding protein [Mycena latifolia]